MNDIILTFDIDWAPDFVIDFIAEHLIKYQVRTTWFVTHTSSAIERLRQYPALFELGIHPNFLSGSTHGTTPDEVLCYCMSLAPEATSVRTHGLVQSTMLLAQVMTQTPITTDVSLYLPHAPYLHPCEYYWQGRTLLRIPFFWEDDLEMRRPKPEWRLSPLLVSGEGLKVFNFHPVHVYLNSSDIGPYEMLKRQVSRLVGATSAVVNSYVQRGDGTQTMFLEVLAHLAVTSESLRIQDVYERWLNSISKHNLTG